MSHNDEARRAAKRKYDQTGAEDDYKAWMRVNCLHIGHSMGQDRDAFEMYCVRCGATQKARFIYVLRRGDYGYAIIDSQTFLYRVISVDSPYSTCMDAMEHNRDETLNSVVPWEWYSFGDMMIDTLEHETVENPKIKALIHRFFRR